MGGRIARGVFVEESSGCENEEALAVSAGEPFLAFDVHGVDGRDGAVIFCGVFGIAEGFEQAVKNVLMEGCVSAGEREGNEL
jgi:hypothetical protein